MGLSGNQDKTCCTCGKEFDDDTFIVEYEGMQRLETCLNCYENGKKITQPSKREGLHLDGENVKNDTLKGETKFTINQGKGYEKFQYQSNHTGFEV